MPLTFQVFALGVKRMNNVISWKRMRTLRPIWVVTVNTAVLKSFGFTIWLKVNKMPPGRFCS